MNTSGPGLRLAARDGGKGAPGVAPVVLLHGLFGHAGNFGAIQRRLAEHRRVIALDLRNHGASPHAEAMSYLAMAADVLETLAQLGALPAVLVGHSMGGKVAMAVTQAAPGQVHRLCVVDIAPRAYASDFARYATAMAAIPLDSRLSRAQADRMLAEVEPDAGVRQFLLQNLRFDRDPPVWRINLAAIEAALPELSAWVPDAAMRYAGPALFIAGSRSDYIRLEDRPAITRHFPSARFATIAGAGHWVHAEAPDEFVGVLGRFVHG